MHIVLLAKQAVRILTELKPLTQRSAWVFPGARTNGEPMSENSLLLICTGGQSSLSVAATGSEAAGRSIDETKRRNAVINWSAE